MSDNSGDLVVRIVRVCFLIVGGNGSGKSRVFDEPSYLGKLSGYTPGKRYQRIRTCLPGEVESSSSPIRQQAPDVKYPEKVERRLDKIADVRYPDGMSENFRPDGMNDDFRPGGMSYATRHKGGRLRGQGRGSHVTFFREDPTLNTIKYYLILNFI
uniref:Uncharacterized protein n=1 Tax=Vitis vinifera TaxID=29760 RepID=A5AQC3_VITVI|nr:hypothetical protein VITISV_028883 [Vitis vinifera]